MSNPTEKVFAQGLIAKRRDAAPEFVTCSLSIKVETPLKTFTSLMEPSNSITKDKYTFPCSLNSIAISGYSSSFNKKFFHAARPPIKPASTSGKLVASPIGRTGTSLFVIRVESPSSTTSLSSTISSLHFKHTVPPLIGLALSSQLVASVLSCVSGLSLPALPL